MTTFYTKACSTGLIALFFCACSDAPKQTTSTDRVDPNQDQKEEVVQPQPQADFTYSFANEEKRFSFPNRNAQDIKLPSGTQIAVPVNCFVDKDGKAVKGDVDLVFEEFLSAGSIISSQITMTYDSAGTRSNFESAGMFRINAFKGDEQLYIAKGKSIDVSLATPDPDKGFHSYYSTRNGDDWAYLGTSSATENTAKAENLKAIQEQIKTAVQPVRPVEYSANGKYFDLNLSHAYTHDLKSLLGIVWEYAGTNKKNDPAYNKAAYNRKWDFVSILPSGDKRGQYEIVLQNKDTTVKTTARPVFRGAVLDEQNQEFATELAEFNKRMEAVYQEKKQAIAEASFLRTLSVKNLGLYNYDRQYHAPDMIPVYANFDFGSDSLKKFPINVYLITGNGLAVIKYPVHDWDKFRYSKKDINKMIAILPDQEICTFSSLRFSKEAPSFPENKPGKYLFVLKHSGVKATDSKSIDRVLSSI
jgi:hypothetical protein